MNNNKNSLVEINENSIIYRLKCFFLNFFKKKKNLNTQTEKETKNITQSNTNNTANIDNDFFSRIKTIEDEHTKLLKLQNQYENGTILEKDLTQEQIDSLCNLYIQQIQESKKRIAFYRSQITS